MTTFLSILVLAWFTGASEALCPKNGVSGTIQGSCYFGVNLNETFQSGDQFCSTYFYGNLASVTTAVDDQMILNLARDMFSNSAQVWLGGVYDGNSITWSDGSPDVYRNFGDIGTQAGYVLLNLTIGKWATATWSTSIPFVCIQKEQVVTTAPPPVTKTPTRCISNSPCPTEWTYSQNLKSCYKAVYDVSYTEAVDACYDMGANLASIHSDEENRIVNEMVRIGFPLTDANQAGLIGGKRTGPGASDWEWLDGTRWDYTKWAAGQPNFMKQQEYCLETYSDQPNWTQDPNGDEQKWNDQSCNTNWRAAICKKAADY